MQFQIPQFIDVEDKIAGPFTLKQLLTVVGAGVVSMIAFSVIPFWGALVIAVVVFSVSLAFALIKVNGQPLPKIAVAAFFFVWNPKLYLWKRVAKEREIEVPEFPEMAVAKGVKKEQKLEVEPHVSVSYREAPEAMGVTPRVAPPSGMFQEPLRGQVPEPQTVQLSRVSGEVQEQRRVIKVAPPSEEAILEQRRILGDFSAGMPLVKKLATDLDTTKTPIAKREKSSPQTILGMAIFRKETGERQVAKRVDFR